MGVKVGHIVFALFSMNIVVQNEDKRFIIALSLFYSNELVLKKISSLISLQMSLGLIFYLYSGILTFF